MTERGSYSTLLSKQICAQDMQFPPAEVQTELRNECKHRFFPEMLVHQTVYHCSKKLILNVHLQK